MNTCTTCKRPLRAYIEIIDFLTKEIDRRGHVLDKRTKELYRTRKALDVAIGRLEFIAQETFQGEPRWINMGFHARAEAALTDIDEIIAGQKD